MTLDKFYKDKRRPRGVSGYCKSCERDRQTEYRNNNYDQYISTRRSWRDKNKDKLKEYNSNWDINNRDKNVLVASRRRARKVNLPDTLTHEETHEIISEFNGKCCICDDKFEHLDHFIPIDTEEGGTTKENIVPMCAYCNISKRNINPFIWIKGKSKEERERFDVLVKYLSDINGIMDVEVYKAHVYKCFE